MPGHAELLAPRRLAAGTGGVVALFRADDALVALRQFRHAGIAVALAVTLLRALAAVAAVDRAQIVEADALAEQRVERDFLLTKAQAVLHRSLQPHRHLAQRTACDLLHQCRVSEVLNRMFGTSRLLDLHSIGPM